MSNEFKLSANDISALKMLGLGDNIANIEKQIGKMPSVLRRQKENEINKLYKDKPLNAKLALADYDYELAKNSGDEQAIKKAYDEKIKAAQIRDLADNGDAKPSLIDQGLGYVRDKAIELFSGKNPRDDKNYKPFISGSTILGEGLTKGLPNMHAQSVSGVYKLLGNDEKANEYAKLSNLINQAQELRKEDGKSNFLENAGYVIGKDLLTYGNVASSPIAGVGKNALIKGASLGAADTAFQTPQFIGANLAKNNGELKGGELATDLGINFGVVTGLGAGMNWLLNRGLKKASDTGIPKDNAEIPNSQTATNTPNSNADDLATNGSWLGDGSTPPPNGGNTTPPNGAASQKIGEVPLNITAIENLKTRQGELNDEIKSANELLKKARTNKTRKRLKEQIKSANDELKAINLELQKPITSDQSAGLRGFDDDGLVRGKGFATDPNSAKAMNANEIAANEAEILGSSKPWSAQKGELVPVKTADIIDLVPDENGVYQVAYNGSSKELAKIATEIAKGDPRSLGAKRLVFIADNIAETAAKDAEQKISANIAKIDDDSVELYANNTALLNDIAKKYPMLNKDEQIELANKQILANASAELLEYSKFLNGGSLPNDARLLGKNAGRMILKSLNAGASKQEIIDMLLKAGISGRNSTAAKALIQTGDINAYNAVMRGGEAELIAELSQNVRVAAKNESIGAILGSAKAKALENDELLKKGVGNQGLDDVTTTFKSSKSGKEFEVAENGFGRELLSYDGQVANEEMKRAFLAWEAQEKKADITLNDGRKVVFLEPDEAVQLSYGNSYLYGEKDLEALFARRRAESLEQKLKRLQSHPAYENLLKMRENTKASELKGDTVGGSKPTVFYEPQSERYLRTQGGGGLPNAERSITITKADVAKLRAHKADVALATKLENNLEALTGDPAASGLIDDLLTRDYHLASAEKKSELVAPKNADEVVGNSRIPSDKTAWAYDKPNAYNAKFSDIIDSSKSDELFEALAKVSDPKKQSAMFKDFTLKNRTDEFSPSGEYNANPKYKDKGAYGHAIQELLKEEYKKGKKLVNSDGEFLLSGKIAGKIRSSASNTAKTKELSAIDHYTAAENLFELFKGSKKLAFHAGFKPNDASDILLYRTDAVINGKNTQILFTLKKEKNKNGSEKVYNLEVDLIPDELKAVANRTQQGPAGSNAKVATPKHEVKTDTANSSKDEIKSQGGGGKLGPLKTDESKNFKVFDGLVGFFEDNLSKRKNAYADFADGGSTSGQRASRYEKSQKIELLDKYLAEYPKAKEISANIAKKLAFANKENKKLNKQQISDLFGYYKNNKENKELLDKNIEYALAKELLEPVLNESEKAFNDIAKKYGLPAKFRGRVMDDIRYRHKLATRATDQTKDQFQIQIFKDFARHLESLEKERSFSVSEAELRAASINDIEFLLKATPHLKQVKSGEDYISELNGLKQQAVMNKINELMAKGANESEFEKLSNHEYISELARAEFAKEHGFEYKAQKVNDKSQEQKRTGLKRGFSTQALNELMLGLGSGGANAVSEDDTNKKAEAFIKGFLAGFGGAKAASMLVKNAPKLAPQLARASEKMASDFPRLLNDRPDILGGVLGRMNNAKDKFSFIFGGEKALGANKAKLKVAKDMTKNGAKDDEIWAKTGWYKDIDGKWKFEINAEGGKLKELNAPELDEATKIIKRDYFDKQMNLKELEDFIEFKQGYIDFDAIKKFYDLPKDMSKGELTQKFPYFKMSVNDYMEHGFYKDIDLLHDEIMPARKMLNQEYSKTPLNEVLDDPELFASYPQLKDVKVSVDELKSTEKAHFNPSKNEIVLSSHLDAEDMKSSLYHEIQHKVQEIEGFARGGGVGNLNYKKLAGEAEARNVQARQAMLKTADKEAGRIISMIKDPQKAMRISKDLANVDEYVMLKAGNKATGAKHIKLRHTSDPNKTGYVSDDEISRLGENMRKFIIKHGEPYFNKENGNFVYEWVENGNAFGLITNSRSLSKPDIFNPTSKTLRAPATDSRSLQLAPFNRVGTPAKDEIITFYSNRNLKTNGAYKFTNPEMTWQKATLPNSQLPHPDKTLDIAPNERIVSFDNSAELGMRESFSPQLKASYDLRDKLLKSTNEVRASLNEKGKAELEKLAGSKDSKLSRDAQIMKTLENAKSNPARYAKLKKLYLNENGKVKDSIGLC